MAIFKIININKLHIRVQILYRIIEKEYLEELQQAFERFNGIVDEEEEQSMK